MRWRLERAYMPMHWEAARRVKPLSVEMLARFMLARLWEASAGPLLPAVCSSRVQRTAVDTIVNGCLSRR